jgi:hypothetical protein
MSTKMDGSEQVNEVGTEVKIEQAVRVLKQAARAYPAVLGMVTEAMSPERHARACGPFCSHVILCPTCCEVRGVCDDHAGSPAKSYRWKTA